MQECVGIVNPAEAVLWVMLTAMVSTQDPTSPTSILIMSRPWLDSLTMERL